MRCGRGAGTIMRTAVSPTLDWYSCIDDDLDVAQRIFDGELLSDVAFINGLVDVVRSYRGKMLRPALLLLSARAAGEIIPAHHTLAAVVEMVHMATLVHDDVLDEADERRRRPTIRSMSGNVTAVLLGDYFISHAFHLCGSLDSQFASRRIGATTNTVCEGEVLQNHHAGDDRLGEADYLDIIERKTGALTAVACELGAHFAGEEPRIVQALRGYGMSVGVAFQIIDDVLDIAGDRSEVGKSLGVDFVLGKPTLPVIHAFRTAPAEVRRKLAALFRGKDAYDRTRLHDILAESGSLDYARAKATGLIRQAVSQLDPIPPSEARTALTAGAQFILQRRF